MSVAGHPTDAFIFAQDDFECARQGVPCRFGPTAKGRCSERAECRPSRTGDRWECTRPMARGGACERGPLPDGSCCFPPESCVPRATIQRKLKRTWRLAALAALGIGLILLFTQAGVSPGSVMAPHAAFEEDCAQCHEDVAHPSLAWAAALPDAGLFDGEKHLANSEKCTVCHRFGDAALAAHGVDMPAARATNAARDQRWTEWSEARQPDLEVRWAAAFVPDSYRGAGAGTKEEQEKIACVTCHRDHEGRDFDATFVTDAQCQVCHAEAFDGFAEHPPFSAYPHFAQTMVAFDHGTHFGRHFATSAKDGIEPPESCASCHGLDDRGAMVVQGFGTCASCHEAEITDPPGSEPYLEFLAPPGLDLETLADHGIGDWPYYAEAEPNAFLHLMLVAGGYLDADDLETIADLDLLDLTDASDEELEAVARLAWAYKTMTRDLVREGPALFVEAARTLHDGAAPDEAWADLAASLPFEVVSHAAGEWFPALLDELDLHEGEEEVPTTELETDFDEPEGVDDIDEWLRYGGWRFQDLALLYRPTGHADRFLRGWLTAATAPTPGAAALFDLLTDEDGPVACAKCHVSPRAETDSEGERRLNWFARGAPEARPWAVMGPAATRAATADESQSAAPSWREQRWHLKPFSHLSHRQAVADGGCVSCHRVVASAEDARGPAGFSPVSPDTCTACHREETELAGCVTCHDYHFQNADGALMSAGGDVTINDPFGE